MPRSRHWKPWQNFSSGCPIKLALGSRIDCATRLSSVLCSRLASTLPGCLSFRPCCSTPKFRAFLRMKVVKRQGLPILPCALGALFPNIYLATGASCSRRRARSYGSLGMFLSTCLTIDSDENRVFPGLTRQARQRSPLLRSWAVIRILLRIFTNGVPSLNQEINLHVYSRP